MTSILQHRAASALLVALGAAILSINPAGAVLGQSTTASSKATAAQAKGATARQVAPAHPQSVSQAQAQAPAQPAQPAQPTVFDDHARQGKIVACARMYSALGRDVSQNASYTAQSQWDSKAGNAHAIQAIVAMKPPPGAPSQQPDAGIVFAAPVGAAGCEGHLVRVTPVSTSCSNVAAELARSNGHTNPLGDLSVSAMPNGAEVMLVPFANNSCVTVTVLRAMY